MARYAIVWDYGHDSHAGSKAPSDAISFLLESGYEPVRFKEINTLKYILFPFMFLRAYLRIERGSRVVFQFPIHSKSTFRVILRLADCLKRKDVERIALVHDINFARGFGGVETGKNLRQLECFSSLIVHSGKMESVLRENGCTLPCRILGLFDYRFDKTCSRPRTRSPYVVFAGNLTKSAFVANLPAVASENLRFNLYGKGHPVTDSPYVVWKNVFSPSDLSGIEGSWGLVWDGDDINSCSGQFGKYLEMNSPHKASLYVCAGLPLIVPEGSAVAGIVRKEKIGIAVRSITEIGTAIARISDEEYGQMASGCRKLAEVLSRGGNLEAALN